MRTLEESINHLRDLNLGHMDVTALDVVVAAARRSAVDIGRVRKLEHARAELRIDLRVATDKSKRLACEVQRLSAELKRERALTNTVHDAVRYWKGEADARRDELARLRASKQPVNVINGDDGSERDEPLIDRAHLSDGAADLALEMISAVGSSETPGPVEATLDRTVIGCATAATTPADEKPPLGAEEMIEASAKVSLPGPLDDPRMDGEQWIDAANVTSGTLSAWPLWDTRHESRTSDSGIRLARYLIQWVDRQGWQWRPLRLPGMGRDGIVQAKDMTPEHFARCMWAFRIIDNPWRTEHLDLADVNHGDPCEQWRPVGWPDEPETDAAQKRPNATRADDLERVLPGVWQRITDMEREIAKLQATRANEQALGVAMDLLAKRVELIAMRLNMPGVLKTSKAPEADAPAHPAPSATTATSRDGTGKPWLADSHCGADDEPASR